MAQKLASRFDMMDRAAAAAIIENLSPGMMLAINLAPTSGAASACISHADLHALPVISKASAAATFGGCAQS